jgi:pimeloyl-ACP methyl ester carboxylesterase
MTSPDALGGMERLIADSGLASDAYPTTVAARIALRIGAYSPGRHAGGITCPALVQIAEHDAVTPARIALRAAHKMANPTVHTYDCGHFDPYVEPLFSTVVTHQLAFLHKHVPLHIER